MSPPLLSYISYGAGSVRGTVRLVILTTPIFDIIMPSDNINSVFWASPYRTWNIFSHRLRVYNNIGIPSKLLALDAVAPLNTGWKKSDNRRCRADGSTTIHAPYFTPGRSSRDPIDRVWDAVLHSSTNDIQNLAPPSPDPPHIPIPPTSINIIGNRGTVSSPYVISLIGVLTILVSTLSMISPPNDIYELDSSTGLSKD